MGEPPFDRDHAPVYGVAEQLAPGLRVVTARNPGPMTFTGTRSYILGSGEVAVIDRLGYPGAPGLIRLYGEIPELAGITGT